MVVGVPDERWGERVVAVVQPAPGAAPTLEELQAHCRDRLAGYKVPRGAGRWSSASCARPAGKADYAWAKDQAATVLEGAGGVKRLSGLDATFLYMETPTTPMHVLGVLLLDT